MNVGLCVMWLLSLIMIAMMYLHMYVIVTRIHSFYYYCKNHSLTYMCDVQDVHTTHVQNNTCVTTACVNITTSKTTTHTHCMLLWCVHGYQSHTHGVSKPHMGYQSHTWGITVTHGVSQSHSNHSHCGGGVRGQLVIIIVQITHHILDIPSHTTPHTSIHTLKYTPKTHTLTALNITRLRVREARHPTAPNMMKNAKHTIPM